MMTTQKGFLNKLKSKGNHKAEFDSIQTKVTVQLYKNGFKVLANNHNDDKSPFFSFNKGLNQALLTNIMESKFPCELLDIKDTNLAKGIGVILEDYSQETYFSVNSNEESATITVKLANGNIFTQIFNLRHTVLDIVDQISLSKLNSAKSFGLLFGYPPKTITDLHQTIKELDLKSGTLIQEIHA